MKVNGAAAERAAGQPHGTCSGTMASMLESAAPAVPSLALPTQPTPDAVDAAFQRAAAERHARATPVRGNAVLRFTTLSNDAPRRGFVIGDHGTVGRGQQNHIQVASDATLCEANHGTFRCQDGVLVLEPGDGVVAVRCSTGESVDYPLRTGCEFGCGSSIFAVSRDAPLALYCREGPLQGRTLDVREALTCVEIKQ